MSEQNARDTQFAGFAKLVLKELDDAIGRITERLSEEDSELDEKLLEREAAYELGTIIARRSYDLVQHTVGHTLEYLHECGHEISGSMNSRIQPSIPDMTNWRQFGLKEQASE